jgi:hypothetical protein
VLADRERYEADRMKSPINIAVDGVIGLADGVIRRDSEAMKCNATR